MDGMSHAPTLRKLVSMASTLVTRIAVVALSALVIGGCATTGSDTSAEDAALLQAQAGLDVAPSMPSSTWSMMPGDDGMDGMHDMMHGDDGDMEEDSGSSIGALNADERQFIVDMIPHHQQAVDMSTLALTRAKDPKVINLATAILAAQAKEISMMTGWVGDADGGHMGHAGHGMDHNMGGMPEHGMLTEDQMRQLRDAKGVKFDQLFLTGMIAHHEGAVTMSQPHISSGNTTLAGFAKAIIKDQTAEITQMKAMLAKL